jgi:hypothetical protein
LFEAVPEHLRATPFWMDEIGHNDHGHEVELQLLEQIRQYLDYHILARRLYLATPTPSNRKSDSVKSSSPQNKMQRLQRSC